MNYIIVANSLNRPLSLVVRCLNAALNQKFKPAKVILIDQNPEPLRLPEEILSHVLFERQICHVKSVSAARNLLIVPKKTDWIGFCDDDGYVSPDYSENLMRIIEQHPELEIIAGSIRREDNGDFYSLRHKKGGSLKFFRNTKNMMGSNFLIKPDSFKRLGGFDEKFGVGAYWGSSEESDLCWNAYFSGIQMEFFQELSIYHIPPFNENIKRGFFKAYRYGIGKGGLVWKWLIQKKKIIVLYEVFEMFTVPFIQAVRGLVTLKPALIATNIATLLGRVLGILKALVIGFTA